MKISDIKESLDSLERDMLEINKASLQLLGLGSQVSRGEMTKDESLDRAMDLAARIRHTSEKYIDTLSLLGSSMMGGNNHGPLFR